jgi:hypothetical protein
MLQRGPALVQEEQDWHKAQEGDLAGFPGAENKAVPGSGIAATTERRRAISRITQVSKHIKLLPNQIAISTDPFLDRRINARPGCIRNNPTSLIQSQ